MPFWDNITSAYFRDHILYDNRIIDTTLDTTLVRGKISSWHTLWSATSRSKPNPFWSELRSLPCTSNSRQSKITPALTNTIYFGHTTQTQNSSSFLTSWKFIPQSKVTLTTVYNSLQPLWPLSAILFLCNAGQSQSSNTPSPLTRRLPGCTAGQFNSTSPH